MEELEAERERAKKQSTKSVYSILFVFLAESAVFPTKKVKALLRSPGNTLPCPAIQSNCDVISKKSFWPARMTKNYPHSWKEQL